MFGGQSHTSPLFQSACHEITGCSAKLNITCAYFIWHIRSAQSRLRAGCHARKKKEIIAQSTSFFQLKEPVLCPNNPIA